MKEFFNWMHKNEMNFSIEAFYDGGFTVRLGDDMNGFKDSANAGDFGEIPRMLLAMCKKHYPNTDWDQKAERYKWQI